VDVNSKASASSPGSTQSARLSARLLEYGTLRTLRRRRLYLGAAAMLAALVWLVLALLYYFNKEVPNALWWGLAATIVLPTVALVIAQLRKPPKPKPPACWMVCSMTASE
jgi:peptidoglycan/LPS O-acetylase OafA/YrhL